jgi:hypothetical protein
MIRDISIGLASVEAGTSLVEVDQRYITIPSDNRNGCRVFKIVNHSRDQDFPSLKEWVREARRLRAGKRKEKKSDSTFAAASNIIKFLTS